MAQLFKFAKSINLKHLKDMDGKLKVYETPQCEVIEMELQGMIAAIKLGYESDTFGGAYRLRINNKYDYLKFFNTLYDNHSICMDRKYQIFLMHSRPESTATEDSEITNAELSGKAKP